MVFKVLLNTKVWSFPRVFLSPSLHLLFTKTARASSHQNTATCAIDCATMCVCAIQLLPSLYIQSCDKSFKSSSPTLFHTDTANNEKLCGAWEAITSFCQFCVMYFLSIHTYMYVCELTFSFEVIPHCLRQEPMGGRSSNTIIEDKQLHGEGA